MEANSWSTVSKVRSGLERACLTLVMTLLATSFSFRISNIETSIGSASVTSWFSSVLLLQRKVWLLGGRGKLNLHVVPFFLQLFECLELCFWTLETTSCNASVAGGSSQLMYLSINCVTSWSVFLPIFGAFSTQNRQWVWGEPRCWNSTLKNVSITLPMGLAGDLMTSFRKVWNLCWNILAAVTGLVLSKLHLCDQSRSLTFPCIFCSLMKTSMSSVQRKSAHENEQNQVGTPSWRTIANRFFCTPCQKTGVPRIGWRNL